MRLPTTTRRAVLGSLSAAALMAAATFPAHAQDELILLESARAPTYLNGGTSAEEDAYMRKVAKDWPLRMVFSERKDKEYVADTDVQIADHRGAPVLSLHNAGPMLYVMLPAGRYRISARLHGITEVHDITVGGQSGIDVYFHWKGKPKIDPWDGKPMGGLQVPG